MNIQPICIYHKDCSDGTAAAATFLHKFPGAKTFPFAYGYTQEDAEKVLSILTPDTVVYTVDCTILVKECLEKGNVVISLDHHISVFEEMNEVAKENQNYTYVFNNDLSGATLAWAYFFPGESVPKWLLLVEDTDLWTKKFEDSQYFVNWSAMQRNKPEVLLELFTNENSLAVCLEKGKSIQDLNDHYLSAYKERAKPLHIKCGEHKIPAYNSTFLQNDIATMFADRDQGVAIAFSIREDGVGMSVRSAKDSKISALEVAQCFGGGGHRNSAGCHASLSDFMAQIA